jgi:adenosylmethionine-8-amino-7-oxononanoate aminotransferase
MWACDLAGVSPDLLCVAKGFTGGVLPMAATLSTARVYDGFRGGRDRALMHGHSFCGNPIGAAIAREVLAIYRDEDIVGQARRKAPVIHRAFAERIATLPGVLRVRSTGMVAAADLGTAGYAGERGWRVHDAARARGIYLRPLGDTVYIAPPLDIPDADLELLLSAVADSIAAASP